ncbi:MAG: PepSY domain-containing protein [Anaerolineae bacterium]
MKRNDWLIAGLLAVLFLFAIGGVMVFWLQSQAYANLPEDVVSGTTTQNNAGAGLTTKDAFLASNELATQWQADAKIISASANIDQFENLEDIYNGQANWTVVYYSPIAAAVAVYTVTENGASFLSSKSFNETVSAVDIDKVVLDSNQAMTIAVSNGAARLLEVGSDRVASLKLEQSIETGRPEWRIFIQNFDNGSFMNFRIDSETGQILEQSNS